MADGNETNVVAALDAVIDRACLLVEQDFAFGIILSRIARELRRTYGVEGAKRFLLEFVANLPPLNADVEVVVPDASYRMGASEQAIWDMSYVLIDHARRMLLPARMFTILLDRVAQRLGDIARPVLIGFADSMATAGQYDQC